MALAQVAQDMPRLTKAPRSTSLKAMSCLWQPRLVEAADASGDGERIGNAYMELYDATGYDAESARRRLILVWPKLSEVTNPVNSAWRGWRMRA
jgi:ATP-binding cassette subfamily F protein 3